MEQARGPPPDVQGSSPKLCLMSVQTLTALIGHQAASLCQKFPVEPSRV